MLGRFDSTIGKQETTFDKRASTLSAQAGVDTEPQKAFRMQWVTHPKPLRGFGIYAC
jgi:hypothetical protein